MRLDPLGQPIAPLVRNTPTLDPWESLARAAKLFRESAFDRLPVVEDDVVIGIVTHHSLAMAFAQGSKIEEPVTIALDPEAPIVSPYITGAEALRLMAERRAPELIVIDSHGVLIGTLAAADLADSGPRYITPPLVGGMATPFGVYLTTGSLRAGASDVALVTTGILLSSLLYVSVWISMIIAQWLFNRGMSLQTAGYIEQALPILFFMASIRAIPLSAIHASEHMVVHAIERGEPLRPEIVKRMPRVHPRCGTNLAVGLSLFSGIFFTPWIASEEIRLFVAAIATLFLWRPLGSLVQLLITTKPPKDKHVAMGIQAGAELMEKYRTTRKRASIPLRIFNSGMLHVLLGSAILTGFLELVAWVFKIQLPF